MNGPGRVESAFCYNEPHGDTPAEMDDKEALSKTQRPPDLAELDRAYRPKILRFLGRMVGEAEAEDLAQEVFFRVSQGLKDFKGRSQVSTWIYRIATNAAVDHLRKPATKMSRRARAPRTADGSSSGREMETDLEILALGGDENARSAETSVIQGEMEQCIRKYIDRLPANQRAAMVLDLFEGMKNAEIAKILRISVQAAKIRLHRGRTRLAKELRSHCGVFRDRRGRTIWDGQIF
ncbi:MAG: sigma-70 family RNA polymerase sigma factor [Candidatus Aminicenantes bacterium]|nr:sigma-70 family RNA polymerase sigma factor [Candidatus Aminicenantes bacterium]